MKAGMKYIIPLAAGWSKITPSRSCYIVEWPWFLWHWMALDFPHYAHYPPPVKHGVLCSMIFQAVNPPLYTNIHNHVLLVKIEGSVWYTIYHQLPIVKGVKQTPPLINQPMRKGHLWIFIGSRCPSVWFRMVSCTMDSRFHLPYQLIQNSYGKPLLHEDI